MTPGFHNVRDDLYPSINAAFPQSRLIVHPMMPESVLYDLMEFDNGYAQTNWTANLVVYTPFVLPEPIWVNQFFWDNGPTILQGVVDMGVYDFAGNKLVSCGAQVNNVRGSGTAALCQVANIPPYYLAGGKRYWLAFGADKAAHTVNRLNPSTTVLDYAGCKQQASGMKPSGSYLQQTILEPPDDATTGALSGVIQDDLVVSQSAPGLPLVATFATPTVATIPIAGMVGERGRTYAS